MKNWIPKVFICVGLFFLLYSAWLLFSTNSAQKETLEHAKSIIADKQKNKKIPDDFNPKIDEIIGILKIPKLNAELPIVEGTDEEHLEKGVGHYRGTAFSGQNDQVVLSGHRDTVFRRLGELEIGDELIVQMNYGTFSYVIESTDIVDADDRTVIRSTAPKEVLTLTTCYPFSYIGNAPYRYIIYATPI